MILNCYVSDKTYALLVRIANARGIPVVAVAEQFIAAKVASIGEDLARKIESQRAVAIEHSERTP